MPKLTFSVIFLMGALLLGCGKETPEPAVMPEQVLMNFTDSTVAIGSNGTIYTQILPENTTDKTLEWTSSEPSVISVDAKGRFEAHRQGASMITATTKAGKISNTVYIVVESDVNRLQAWVNYINVPTYSYTAMEVYMNNASNQALTITSMEIYYGIVLWATPPIDALNTKVPAQSVQNHVYTYDTYSSYLNSYRVKIYFTLANRDYAMTIFNGNYTTEIINQFPIGIEPDWDEGNTVEIPEE